MKKELKDILESAKIRQSQDDNHKEAWPKEVLDVMLTVRAMCEKNIKEKSPIAITLIICENSKKTGKYEFSSISGGPKATSLVGADCFLRELKALMIQKTITDQMDKRINDQDVHGDPLSTDPNEN